jgi:hypothetical protein
VALRARSGLQLSWSRGTNEDLENDYDSAGTLIGQYQTIRDSRNVRVETMAFGLGLVGYF